jgi:hypothetical protein
MFAKQFHEKGQAVASGQELSVGSADSTDQLEAVTQC